MRHRFGFVAVLLTISLFAGLRSAAAQDRAAGVAIAFARAQHLRYGINAAQWFAQSNNYSAARTNSYIDASDIALMEKMGFDYVRLSIDPVPLEMSLDHDPGPNGSANDDFLARLDRAVDTMLADHLAVIIDIHPSDQFKQQLRTSNDAVARFTMLWRKLAAHYANRDPNMIFFEILNEPEFSDPYQWAGVQAHVAAAIRAVAPHNTIIAAGPNYSGIQDLLTLQPLADGNVIYNFHFYEPSEFAQQGANWSVPYWSYIHGVPYPPTAGSMQKLLKEVPDPADRFDLENYWLNHWDAQHIRMLIDEAADWARSNHVPLICDEFGSYRTYTDPVSRANWIHDVRTALEADGIGWAMWEYRGGFGIVSKHDGQPAQVDESIVKALGLTER